MKRVFLFLVSTIVTGAFAAIGSMVGHFFGSHLGVVLGGVFGGLFGAIFSVRIAVRLRWVGAEDFYPTTIGAAIGFLAAATIAVNTLSSPIGPILSSFLVGIGALIGSLIGARRRSGSLQA
ncbi:MAG TPA: hypothetical protein VGQ98_00355 [Gemmatimonadaceae bacterium]|nr:hypothetical protein [Gemmatimonadaceae bacterium]